jgi:hypothetical protein
VLQVIYAVDGGDRRLFVGQQVDVFIDASELSAALPRSASNNISP